MNAALVSVVMAVYNGERFLKDALESLYAQDYDPFEVILVDDGSSDSTPEIAQAFPLTYARQENQGPAAARNTALTRARGEFVAIFDGDDLLPPNRLTVQAGYLAENPEVSVVLGRQEWIDPPPWLTRDPVYGELDGIPLPSAVFRRSALDDVGGFDPTFRTSEDMDLLIRLRERNHKIVVLPDLVLYRRFHGENLSHVGRPAKDPILRSLKAKLDRERARRGEDG
jgi:glycosyltransferase involved in cell wall biosynthesis